MLTKEEIEIQSKEVYSLKAYKDYARAYALGATWANETLSAQIAELQAVNSEQAQKIVDLQTRRDEHLRTIAELMGEKAELVEHSGVLERLAKELTSEKMELLNLLRENLETTPAAMDYIQIRLKTKRTLEKHGVK